MQLHFFKYQGTGNDFVILDGMTNEIKLSNEQVALLCDRKFGIGADGLMILAPSDHSDFKMVYYNSDGNQSTMCGNGGRCIAKFANQQGHVGSNIKFEAIDGDHQAKILESGIVELEMIDVDAIEINDAVYVLDTGSPHYVKFSAIKEIDIVEFGRSIRYSEKYRKEGINVNLVTENEDCISIKTYERGVEDETLSCGTGVTAAAISSVLKSGKLGEQKISVKAVGGDLYVKLNRSGERTFDNIWLCGPAQKVFEGNYDL